MSAESRQQNRQDGLLEHPGQTRLRRLLLDTSLPQAAYPLIREAIGEYDSVLRLKQTRDGESGGPQVGTTFSVHLPEDVPGILLAGQEHLLTVKFTGQEAPAVPDEEVYSHLVVAMELRNLERTKVYPDNRRYVALDRYGNSRPTGYLLAIPASARNYNGRIGLRVLNGTKCVVSSSLHVRLR